MNIADYDKQGFLFMCPETLRDQSFSILIMHILESHANRFVIVNVALLSFCHKRTDIIYQILDAGYTLHIWDTKCSYIYYILH